MALNDGMVFFSGLIIFVIAIVGSLAFGENIEITVEINNTGVDWSQFDSVLVNSEPKNEYLLEGAEHSDILSISELNVRRVSFTLTWTDEPDANFRYSNTPDTFTISVTGPDGSISGTDSASNGEIVLGFELIEEGDTSLTLPFENGTGDWKISISVNTGDQEPIVPDPFGMRTYQDEGNKFTLDMEYEYYSDGSEVEV